MTYDRTTSPDPADVLANQENEDTNNTVEHDDGSVTTNPSANPASDGTETEVVNDEGETEVSEKPPHTEVDEDFVFLHTADERRNIPGTSQYHDLVERKNAEILRAKAEGREPDLENAPAYQGSPLVTVAQARQTGLNVRSEDGDNEDSAVEVVTLPIVVEDSALDDEAKVTYDAFNGPGGSHDVNQGVPTP